IIKKLAALHHNVCVVGDDAQSIYAFRGAKIENIFNFRTDYPEHKLFKLEQNYRSTQNIVNAANSVIAKNNKQIQKNVFSEKHEGELIDVYEAYTDAEEGYIVANKITDMRMAQQFHYKDFAILYRTNAQSRVFEESLRKKNIPYRIFGGLSFYQRKEIKDILAYCRIVVNPNDNEALKRVINYPKRGIGASSIAKIEAHANHTGQSMWQIVKDFEKIVDIKSSGRLLKPLAQFRQLVLDFVIKNQEINASEIVQIIVKDTGMLKDLYVDKSPEGISRYENLQELTNAVQEFVSDFDALEGSPILENYLQNVALLSDQDKKSEENDYVSLMTIHSSKGLEFKNVFLVGVEEELFPSQMSVHSAQELEEERRLFYVAVTRAEENLIISCAKSRFRWGQVSSPKPSRFINEIDAQYLDWHVGTTSKNFDKKPREFRGNKELKSKQKLPNSQRKLSPISNVQNTSSSSAFKTSTLTNLKTGDIVEHQKFGEGKVIEINIDGNSVVAIVDFKNVGQKQLLLKFAKLKIIKK
ncbi:MAG: ATP-binding domain-containing protein, partial [Bacteroidales bacterium]|nr:ATP-binding domain-containing protein [Bacteroidales bacterium]